MVLYRKNKERRDFMDWNEVFKDYKHVSFEQISEYVDTVKPEYSDILRKNINDGLSFLAIKKAFYQMYFKEYIPVAKPKKPTMKDWATKK